MKEYIYTDGNITVSMKSEKEINVDVIIGVISAVTGRKNPPYTIPNYPVMPINTPSIPFWHQIGERSASSLSSFHSVPARKNPDYNLNDTPKP